jgi:hypothetical protein
MDAALALDASVPSFAATTGQHEAPGKVLTTHAVLQASATGEDLRSLQVVYPTRSEDPAPAIARPPIDGVAALTLEDLAGDRRMLAVHRAGAGTPIALPAATSGFADVATDGARAVFDARADGTLRLAWAEEATRIAWAGVEHLAVASPGELGLALGPGRAELVVRNADDEVSVRGLPFAPLAADGACALEALGGGEAVLRLSRERRVTLRADGGNSAPAADPGPDRFVPLGARVPLDASASCDRDGDALTATWEMISAPAGASWGLDDADGPLPSFLAGVRGLYRLRLTVRDAHGATSLPAEVVVRAVAPAEDADGDVVPDDEDDCPLVADPAQADDHPAASGGNGVGDACECSDGDCIAGGGPSATDCALEVRSLTSAAVDGRRLRCRDGDACDGDPAPGICGFEVLLCLANEDAARPACTSFLPRELRVQHWLPGPVALLGPLGTVPGAQAGGPRSVVFAPPLAAKNACTAPIRLAVPAPGRALHLAVRGARPGEVDADRLRFVCER